MTDSAGLPTPVERAQWREHPTDVGPAEVVALLDLLDAVYAEAARRQVKSLVTVGTVQAVVAHYQGHAHPDALTFVDRAARGSTALDELGIPGDSTAASTIASLSNAAL